MKVKREQLVTVFLIQELRVIKGNQQDTDSQQTKGKTPSTLCGGNPRDCLLQDQDGTGGLQAFRNG